MTNRSPILVFILTCCTCGLYYLYWLVSTKIEMNKLGAGIPTAWLLIIPFVNLYWLWRWSQGVEKVTQGALSAALMFVLCLFLGIIGAPFAQSKFNQVAAPTA